MVLLSQGGRLKISLIIWILDRSYFLISHPEYFLWRSSWSTSAVPIILNYLDFLQTSITRWCISHFSCTTSIHIELGLLMIVYEVLVLSKTFATILFNLDLHMLAEGFMFLIIDILEVSVFNYLISHFFPNLLAFTDLLGQIVYDSISLFD